MTNAQRLVLAAEPVPVDETGRPAEPGVGRDPASKGWRLHWLTGLRKQLVGPVFVDVREACAASRFLRERAQA